jgi:hypothetical protein
MTIIAANDLRAKTAAGTIRHGLRDGAAITPSRTWMDTSDIATTARSARTKSPYRGTWDVA